MCYITFQNGVAKSVETDLSIRNSFPESQDRWSWNSFAQVEKIAAELSENTSKKYIATDAGLSCFPRYGVMEMYLIGDGVSISFNGDSYPAGTIVSISKCNKIIMTDTGKKFLRRKSTGSWVNNSFWFLRIGHHSEQNPSF